MPRECRSFQTKRARLVDCDAHRNASLELETANEAQPGATAELDELLAPAHDWPRDAAIRARRAGPDHSRSSVTHCDALIDATSAMVRSSMQAPRSRRAGRTSDAASRSASLARREATSSPLQLRYLPIEDAVAPFTKTGIPLEITKPPNTGTRTLRPSSNRYTNTVASVHGVRSIPISPRSIASGYRCSRLRPARCATRLPSRNASTARGVPSPRPPSRRGAAGSFSEQMTSGEATDSEARQKAVSGASSRRRDSRRASR